MFKIKKNMNQMEDLSSSGSGRRRTKIKTINGCLVKSHRRKL